MTDPTPSTNDYQYLIDHADHQAKARTYNVGKNRSDYGIFAAVVDLDEED